MPQVQATAYTDTMTIPDYQTLMKPLLVLSQNEQKFRDSIETISDEFSLTREERLTRVPSGSMTLIQNRIAWAITYLVKAGIVERKRRGYFSITDSGKQTLAENPERIDMTYLLRFPSFVEFRQQRKKGTKEPKEIPVEDAASLTPVEQIGNAYDELRREVERDLLDRILLQNPDFFERLVVELMKAMGYAGDEFLAEAVGKSGDGGIDGIIHQDSLGLEAVYIQAKRYDPSHTVGRPDLQAFPECPQQRACSSRHHHFRQTWSRIFSRYSNESSRLTVSVLSNSWFNMALEFEKSRPTRSIESMKTSSQTSRMEALTSRSSYLHSSLKYSCLVVPPPRDLPEALGH